MKNIFKPFIFLVLTWMFISLGYASDFSEDQRIKQRVTTFMKRYRIPGAAVIISHHGNMKTYLFGEAIPAKHVPVTEDTIFELGSITKVFTSTLLAENVMSGRSHLTDPIRPYLDRPHSLALGRVTYLDLATHSSGLPFNARNLPYNAEATPTYQLRFNSSLQRQRPFVTPGSKMLYSNYGYGLLGHVLAKKEQTSLPELMKRNILNPLNMHTSGLDIAPSLNKYLAQGYSAQGYAVPYHTSGLLGGAWAMRSSVKDMRTYLKAALGDTNSPHHVHQAIRLTQVPYYSVYRESMQMGLGWVIMPLNKRNSAMQLIRRPEHFHFVPVQAKKIGNPRFNPHALIGKTGATDGFRAYIAMIPERDTGIVIMINKFFHFGRPLTSMANQMLLEKSYG